MFPLNKSHSYPQHGEWRTPPVSGPTPANVIEHLQPVLQAIRDAKNDGQATGLAVKHLTANGVRLEGSVVAAAVKQLRQN